MQVGVGEDLVQACDVAVEVAFSAGLGQQSAQSGRGQFGCLSWCGCGGQDGSGIGASQPALGQFGERDKGGRVEVFEQVADLVADLLARPDASCWARASTRIVWASSVSAGSGRCAAASVRTMLASSTASVASDLAPETAYLARYREAASGLIG